MARPTNALGGPAGYPHGMVGEDHFDDENLPPLSRAIRDSWWGAAHPVSSAASAAAMFAAIVELERRVIALGS